MGQVLCCPKNGNITLPRLYRGYRFECALWERSCQSLCMKRQLTVGEAGSGALEERGGAGDERVRLWFPSAVHVALCWQSAPRCQSELSVPEMVRCVETARLKLSAMRFSFPASLLVNRRQFWRYGNLAQDKLHQIIFRKPCQAPR